MDDRQNRIYQEQTRRVLAMESIANSASMVVLLLFCAILWNVSDQMLLLNDSYKAL